MKRALILVITLTFISGALVGVTAAAPAPPADGAVRYQAEAGRDCTTAVERELLDLINDYRTDNGLAELRMSRTLVRAAFVFSADRANRNYRGADHLTLGTGATPQDRMRAAGYPFVDQTATGENIARGFQTSGGVVTSITPSEVFVQWRDSTRGHNEIMLDPDFTTIGIARATNQAVGRHYYWTADFGGRFDEAAPSCDGPRPPTVRLTAPAAGAQVANGRELRATASAGTSAVRVVRFAYCPGTTCSWDSANRRIIGEDVTAAAGVYSVPWSNQPANGPYTLLARAIDTTNRLATSAPVTVSVANGGGATRYVFVAKWGTAGGSGNLNLEGPSGVAFYGEHVYVVDRRNNRIQKFGRNGGYVDTFGSFGSGVGQLNSPWGIAVDGAGNVYVTEQNTHRVTKFDHNGENAVTWGGPTAGAGNTQFNNPLAVAVDRENGFVYVADSDNARVQKFNLSGVLQGTLGTQGSGRLQFPQGVAVDADGNVYVADGDLNQILKFGLSGQHIVSWGAPGSGNQQFNGPAGIEVDGNGTIFVADSGNNRIQILDRTGRFQTPLGSAGSGDGQFNAPDDVAVDGAGNIYVTDALNNRVQKFGPVT